VARALGDGRIGERAAVHEKHIEPAVVVEIEEEGGAPDDLGQELLVAGAVDVTKSSPAWRATSRNAGGAVFCGCACWGGAARQRRQRQARLRDLLRLSPTAETGEPSPARS
jgi:hypothetical protein